MDIAVATVEAGRVIGNGARDAVVPWWSIDPDRVDAEALALHLDFPYCGLIADHPVSDAVTPSTCIACR